MQDGSENSILMYNRSQCHCNRILDIAGGISQLMPSFNVLKREGYLLETIVRYSLIYDHLHSYTEKNLLFGQILLFVTK